MAAHILSASSIGSMFPKPSGFRRAWAAPDDLYPRIATFTAIVARAVAGRQVAFLTSKSLDVANAFLRPEPPDLRGEIRRRRPSKVVSRQAKAGSGEDGPLHPRGWRTIKPRVSGEFAKAALKSRRCRNGGIHSSGIAAATASAPASTRARSSPGFRQSPRVLLPSAPRSARPGGYDVSE